MASAAPQLMMGTFDAERFWRDPDLASLPSFPDPDADRIVAAMDELLFALCEPQDHIVTRYRMDACHVAYLHEIGFRFEASRADLEPAAGGSPAGAATVFDLLSRTSPGTAPHARWPAGTRLSPFAVIPGAEQAAAAHGLVLDCPTADAVRRVNSKLYSMEMNRRLGVPTDGLTVYSPEELLACGQTLLRQGPFLIKDEFGVSGKGNLLIQSEAILRRIAAHLEGQVKHGKRVRFIVEPFLRKRLDFSCQFTVDADGGYRLISVQKVLNSNFSYQGSVTADDVLLAELREKGYFDMMRQVARELYGAGYYGDACVDSMLLEDGRIVPIVEVNARKSMSLIKQSVDRRLQQHGVQGSMTCVNVQLKRALSFEQLLALLEREDLLFRPERGRGAVPLGANTLLINRSHRERQDDRKHAKGRLYLYIVADEVEQSQLLASVRETLAAWTNR